MHLYKADNKILNGWKWPKKRLYEQLFWVIFSYRNVQYNKLVLEFHTAFFRHFLNLFSTRASSSSTFPLIHRTAFWWPWNMYRTGISRPCPAPRLTLVPKTSARIEVLGRDRNLQKKPQMFSGTCPTIARWKLRENQQLLLKKLWKCWTSCWFSLSLMMLSPKIYVLCLC